MNYSLIRIFLLLVILTMISCEKPEGLGGNSSISGKITVRVFDKQFKVLQDSYPATDENVFILYGNDEYLLDDVNTSYSGVFQFDNLTKGDYTVFVYSEDSTLLEPLNDVKIEKKVSLKSNKEDSDIGNINIYKTIDYDDGNAVITGYAFDVNFVLNFVKDTTAAIDQDIYLFYENQKNYIERIQVQENGVYAFANLIKGEYTIKTYGKNPDGDEKKTYTKTVTVYGLNETVCVPSFYMYND